MQTNKVQELVINFHMTEACNYRCGYCYATWDNHVLSSELHHIDTQVSSLLSRLADYFLSDNQLKNQLGYQKVRINFAGGEPIMLGSRFVEALLYAKSLGFNTSIITNGHFLSAQILSRISTYIDMLGISFDTGDYLIADSIGRLDRKGNWLSPEKLVEICSRYRLLNPTGKLKLNTVVNAFNWRENLTSTMKRVKPDKWKLLRVLPVQQQDCTITNEQYRAYVERHHELTDFVVEEDNDAMWQSYLMINPDGCFYQNSGDGEGHTHSKSILDIGVEKAFQQISFNVEAFARRYQSPASTDSFQSY